jgi:hypothetical protein
MSGRFGGVAEWLIAVAAVLALGLVEGAVGWFWRLW